MLRRIGDRIADVDGTERNGRKTLTTVQGLPVKFSRKKILTVVKKKFACNGTIVNDEEMGEVIQLQGDQRKNMQEFLTDKEDGLALDTKTIKVRSPVPTVCLPPLTYPARSTASKGNHAASSVPRTLSERQAPRVAMTRGAEASALSSAAEDFCGRSRRWST